MHACKKELLITVSLILLMLNTAYGGDVSIHGFIQGNYSVNTDRENPDGGDFKWAEERVQLKLDVDKELFRLFLKADAFYDHIDDEAGVELREGYADYTASKWDIRAGRQVITWGIGDMLFINDVFPKDYEAFYSGRPIEYLKKAVDGVKLGLYPSAMNFELVLIPFFEPNTYPRGERFHSSSDIKGDEPAVTFDNTEFSLRAYRSLSGFDTSVYIYKGFFRAPSMQSGGGFFYPELSVFGGSIEGSIGEGILGLEAGYYDSKDDRAGANPSLPNSTSRLITSYKRQLMEDFNIGLQFYMEYMHRYSEYEKNLPFSMSKEDKLYELITVRLTRLLMHQNLTLSLFTFYSPSDADWMLNPEVKYKFTDNLGASLGGNIFEGNMKGRWGGLKKNDNAYFQMRYEF
ncbi:MAG: hypothetical protein HY805_10050 [Nitrospirae bacterium]|nr:hypothetical protein [Nitrospirota bacterium]